MATKPTVDVEQIPHYRIAAEEVARWLDLQGPNSWWSVDGDPYLMEKIFLPALSEELAEAFRKSGRWLILHDVRSGSNANGETISADWLNGLAYVHPNQDREFVFRWENDPWRIEWLLAEDKELSVLSQGLDEVEN